MDLRLDLALGFQSYIIYLRAKLATKDVQSLVNSIVQKLQQVKRLPFPNSQLRPDPVGDDARNVITGTKKYKSNFAVKLTELVYY